MVALKTFSAPKQKASCSVVAALKKTRSGGTEAEGWPSMAQSHKDLLSPPSVTNQNLHYGRSPEILQKQISNVRQPNSPKIYRFQNHSMKMHEMCEIVNPKSSVVCSFHDLQSSCRINLADVGQRG